MIEFYLAIFTLKLKYAQIQASAFFSLWAPQEMPKIGSLWTYIQPIKLLLK